MQNYSKDVEIVSVNYNTPDLIERLNNSIKRYIGEDYLFTIIDGSTLNYYNRIEHLNKGLTKIIHFNFNIHHGPGMDYAIRNSTYEYVLLLDSDVTILKEGLIEKMMSLFKDGTYCVAQIVFVNRRGENEKNGEIAYAHPHCMLIKRSEYFKYRQFKLHGAPCIDAMIDINDNKKVSSLINFNRMEDYINEEIRGTVSRFGYGIKKARKVRKKMSPVINIPVRTSGRPNYFRNCYYSIANQSYQNINLIVSVDDDESYEYVKKLGVTNIVVVQKLPIEKKSYFDNEIGRSRRHAPYNLHLNTLYDRLTSGYVVGMDDDDMFANDNAIEEIVSHIISNEQLLFWRVKFPNGQIIPPDSVWGQRPYCCKFSGLGYAWNIKYKEYTYWDEWSLGDYRSASRLYRIVKDKVYINKVLSKVQRKQANGLGRRDDL